MNQMPMTRLAAAGGRHLRLPRVALLISLAALLLGIAPAVADAGQRARLTWDTDATDIDLHVWDEDGNHTWYSDRDAIPDSLLSTDITYGFGPERFEEFEPEVGRTYTYGVCYYGSNRSDGVVPETVATVEITDPDGTVRTLRRTLVAEREAYFLGGSPSGGYRPSNDWCRTSGTYHDVQDQGPASAPSTFEGCPRIRRRIGPVELCADRFEGNGPIYTAAGNVRVNGSVALGDGPVSVNLGTSTLSAPGASVAVMRGAQRLPIAAGDVTIVAKPTTDPLSGRGNLASFDIGAARPELQALRAAGLPLTATELTGGVLSLYLDRTDGGGVIVKTKLGLPFAANLPSLDALAIGVYGGGAAAIRPVGGAGRFAGVTLPGGWGLNDVTLAYAAEGDAWSVAGSLKTPWLGLALTGSLAEGRLDALGVTVTRDVPLGSTGFILASVGGSVSGIVRPPLRIRAEAAGRWGSVPGRREALIHFTKIGLGVDLSGKADMTGRISFLSPNGPINAKADLDVAIAPFRASGSLETTADVGPLEVTSSARIAMGPGAFTAAGSATGKLRGIGLSRGARGVVSNRGIGISGQLCVLRFCEDVGAGMNWADFPRVQYIGGDVDRFATISRSAARPRVIRVARGRPFLFVDATGPAGTVPSFAVRGPNGKTYTTTQRRSDSRVTHDRTIGYTGLTIAHPAAGRWVVSALGANRGKTDFVSQSIRPLSRVHVTTISPRGSRRKPIRRKHGSLTVRWSSRGLPRSARVRVYVTQGKTVGRFVAANRPARGSVRVPRRLLYKGVNRVRLIVSDDGVPIDDVIARQVIRAR